jgi:hypothetical protein
VGALVDLAGAEVENLMRVGREVRVGENWGGEEEEQEEELTEHGVVGVVFFAVAI